MAGGSTAATKLRRRRLTAAYATGLVGRGFAVLAPLVIIPVLLQALGEENFGVWATVTSFTAMLVFADLGLGSGLLTKLSSAYGKDDLAHGRRLASDSYFAITVIAALGLALALAVVAWGDVATWLGVREANRPAAEDIIAVVACGFFVTMPLSLITRVQLGVQQAWQSNIWAAVGPLVSIPLAWGLAARNASPAVVVAGAVAGPILVLLANNVVFFLGLRIGRSLRPRLGLVSWVGIRGLVGLGSAFAGLSILSNVALNVDNTLIAVVLGSAEVTVFAIAARLFRSIALLVSIVALPLWGANGEALARGDLAWVRRTTQGTAIGLGSLAALLAVGVVLFRERIVLAWVGPEVDTPLVLYSGFGAWLVLVAFVSPYFMVQNAAGLIQIQALGWAAYLVLSVGAKALVLPVVGTSAVPWITAIGYAVTVVPSAILGFRRVMRRHEPVQARAALTEPER